MKRLWPILAVVALATYPLVFATPSQQRIGALVLLYAISASAWNIVGGYAGQVSVGHAMFFGCGVYGTLASYSHFGLPPIVGLPIGVTASIAISALIGAANAHDGSVSRKRRKVSAARRPKRSPI